MNQKESPWQPIDTAPKTSKAILVWCPENKCTYLVSWNGAHWVIFGGNFSLFLYQKPTLWMPVPVPIEKDGLTAFRTGQFGLPL